MAAEPRLSVAKSKMARVICKATCSFLRRAARFACCEPEIASLTVMVEDGFVGYYHGNLPSWSAGDMLSGSIEADRSTFTGASTRVSDYGISITSGGGSQSQPYNLTWSATMGSYDATQQAWTDTDSTFTADAYLIPEGIPGGLSINF